MMQFLRRGARASSPLLLAIFLVSPLGGDEPDRLRVFNAQESAAAGGMLMTHLVEQLRPHFVARRAEIKAIVTPEAFYERQQKIRSLLMQMNGPLPDRTPLNGRTIRKIQRDGYVIENVIYESRPGHHVTANLYIPEPRHGRIPGVLIPCGHSANGKAAGPYQSIAISLAQHGLISLVYDPIGQGERIQLLDKAGAPLAAGTSEHTLLGVGGWLVGTGTSNYRIWDGIRSLDYLAERPEVDADRLGCTGNSGGGTMTAYLMAFDQRIKAAAPSCYMTTLERLFDTIGPQDAEQNFPGQVALGVEHADYIAARAPLPTLLCVGTQDYFDIDGAWTTFREAKGIYGLLGHGERIDLFEYNDKHGFSLPRRQAAMRFLRRWLLEKDDNPDERPMQLSTDAELQCTRTGQVLGDFSYEVSAFDWNRRRAQELIPARTTRWKRSPQEAIADVQRLTGFRPVSQVPQVDRRGTIAVTTGENAGWTGRIDKLVLRREGEFPIPALLFVPDAAEEKRRAAVVYVASDGKSADAAEGGPIARLAADGKIVLAIDVRGRGETTATRKPRDGYIGTDRQLAMLALHSNRPLLGQRTEDVITATNWLVKRNDVDTTRLELVGVGSSGPIVLHAAAFESRFNRVTIRGAISSWTDVVNEPRSRDQLTNVVPAALVYYDLPDLVRTIGPGKVSVEQPVDPTGRPIEIQSPKGT
jgi:cephalosporin-C deacetylase-like acetyl esterase